MVYICQHAINMNTRQTYHTFLHGAFAVCCVWYQYICNRWVLCPTCSHRKYAVRSRGSLVHGRLRDCTVRVSQEEVVESLLLVGRKVNRQIPAVSGE